MSGGGSHVTSRAGGQQWLADLLHSGAAQGVPHGMPPSVPGAHEGPQAVQAHSFIMELKDYQDCYGTNNEEKRVLVDTVVNPDGSTYVMGNKFLKSSQAYPRGFGKAVADLYMEHR
eukprot:8022137-Pyramimonas_sp.AAC.1